MAACEAGLATAAKPARPGNPAVRRPPGCRSPLPLGSELRRQATTSPRDRHRGPRRLAAAVRGGAGRARRAGQCVGVLRVKPAPTRDAKGLVVEYEGNQQCDHLILETAERPLPPRMPH